MLINSLQLNVTKTVELIMIVQSQIVLVIVHMIVSLSIINYYTTIIDVRRLECDLYVIGMVLVVNKV